MGHRNLRLPTTLQHEDLRRALDQVGPNGAAQDPDAARAVVVVIAAVSGPVVVRCDRKVIVV